MATGISIAFKYFGKRIMPDGKPQHLSEFKEEWDALSDAEKAQLSTGIENGTFTY